MARKKKGDFGDDATDNNPYWRRVERMKKFRDTHSKTWRRNEYLLFGENQPASAVTTLASSMASQSAMDAIAYAWGLVKSLETSIYVQNPEIAFESFDAQFREWAKKLANIVQYDITTMDVKSLGNLMLVDNFIYGYGALMERMVADKYESEDGEDVVINGQDFEAVRLMPWDTLFDPQGTLLDLSNHRYIANAWYPTIADLVAVKTFNLPDNIEEYPESAPLTRRDDKRTDRSTATGNPDSTQETDPEYKTICCWEFWDKESHEKVSILDYSGKIIGKEPWECDYRFRSRKLFPMTLMAMNPQPHVFYPKPELDLIAPQLVEMNIIQAQMRKDTMMKFRKVVMPAALLTKDQQAEMTNTDKQYNVVTYNDEDIAALVGGTQNQGQFDINRFMAVVDQPTIERDLAARYELLKQDIAHIIGWGSGDRGGLTSTRSAREAMMINESKNQRLQKRFDTIADFYRLFASKHVQLMRATLMPDLKRYARVLPSDVTGASQFFTYTKNDLGNFMFDVYAGSSAPKTTESRKAMELQLFQAVAPVLQAAGLPLTPAFYRLADAFQWKGVDELFQNQKGALKEFAAMVFAFEAGQASPQQFLEAGAKAIMTGLNPGELAEVKQIIDQQTKAKTLGGALVGQPGAGASGPGGDQNPLGTAAMQQ